MLIALLSLASPVDFTGYLVDTLCWSYPNHEAPPTRNTPLAERPYDHTLECLRDISFCFDDLKLLAFDNATQRYDVKFGSPPWEYLHKGSGWTAVILGVANCALGAAIVAPGGAKPYEAALSIGVAVCLGVLTAPVVALGVYKGCREAMGPGVGSTEFETSSQAQVDALTMKGSSKI